MLYDKPILAHVSFDSSLRPYIHLVTSGKITTQLLFETELPYNVDTSLRFCKGYYDLEKRTSHACPEHAHINDTFEQCSACQKRTGFNPAFYHAKTISEQQQKLNQQPHALYLAYFAPDVVKVGISQAHRVKQRLLEQGARRAIILETCSSALIARQYEARISELPSIVEHLRRQTKLKLFQTSYDDSLARNELESTLAHVEASLATKFSDAQPFETEPHFYRESIDITKVIDVTEQLQLTGTIVAVVGSDLITQEHDTLLVYDLKRYVGRQLQIRNNAAELALPQTQLTLF